MSSDSELASRSVYLADYNLRNSRFYRRKEVVSELPALVKPSPPQPKVVLERASAAAVRVDADTHHREPPEGGFFAAKTQLTQAEKRRLYEKAARLRPAIWDAQRTVEEAREVRFQAEMAGHKDVVEDIDMRLGIMEARNFPSA